MDFSPNGKYKAQNLAAPKDSSTLETYWNAVQTSLSEEGYYSAKLQVEERNLTIEVGPQSQWVVIPPQKGPDGYLIEGGALIPSKASKISKDLISHYSQKGYPFVKVSHVVIKWQGDTLQTALEIDLGPLITVDSIVVKGMEDARETWVEKYTKIKMGSVYNSAEIAQVNRRLNQLGYVQMTREPAMIFSKEKNVLFLYGKYRSSNRFDGLIGLNTDDEGNAFFTGELDLGLQNIFKRGEQIDLAWRSPGQGSQELNARVAWPFLFSTPAGIEVAFDLFRRDSTFSSRNFSALATYLVSPELIAKAGYQGDASNPLGSSGSSIGINTGNSSINWFVLGADYRDFTGDIIPRKGWTAFAEISQGSRSAEGVNSTVYKALLDVERFQPIAGNHHLYFKGTAHYLLGADFFENEIFREGGIHSMRGFNEQSLITPQFTRLTLSYRFFVETNSYFEFFNDLGTVVNQGITTETTFLWGTGAGLGFQTRGGIFTLAYALGRTDQTSFDLRTGKVHLGYINQF